MKEHLDDETIARWLDGELSGPALADVETHIDECADCRQLVSDLAPPQDDEASPDSRAEIGTVLGGRFRLDALAGQGGMGRVYRAHDLETAAVVAVKRVDRDEARFVREARVLARIDHPAVVRHLFDGTADPERPFFAMEWLDGESLADRLLRGPLTVDDTLLLGHRVASALGAAHGLGVVHRDVKPSNIILPAGDLREVKVVDFGVARAAPARLSSVAVAHTGTRTGTLLGTPAYMAPEQARGDQVVDARADVFSLGCVLFECLTGERAFAGKSVLAVLSRILSGETTRVRTRARHVPRTLDALVARMLARDPARRPASGGEVVRELEEISRASWKAWLRAGVFAVSPARLLAAGIVFLLAVGGGAYQLRALHPASLARDSASDAGAISLALANAPADSAALTDAALVGQPITAFAAPATVDPSAAAEYMSGLESIRGARLEAALRHFVRATELQPGFAAAELRLAMWSDDSYSYETRAHFRRAGASRASLSARDQEIADVLGAVFLREPPDTEAYLEGFLRLSHQRPDDAEVGILYATNLRGEAAAAEYRRVLALDPSFAEAWWFFGGEQVTARDLPGAKASIGRCREISPLSTDCAFLAARVDTALGDCASVEADARAVLAIENGSDLGYWTLANALYVRGADRGAVAEALQQHATATPATTRGAVEAEDAAELAVAYGDLAGAQIAGKRWKAAVDSNAFAEDRVRVTTFLLDVAHERGEVKRAGEVGAEFLQRLPGWRSLAGSPHDDPRVIYSAAAVRAGLRSMDQHVKLQREWQARWTGQPDVSERDTWIEGQARPALYDEALVPGAIAVAPSAVLYSPSTPLPSYSTVSPLGFTAEASARVLLRAGRTAEARAALEDVTRSCEPFPDLLGQLRAFALLGQADEEASDRAGACAAYAMVLRRVGAARPGETNVTLDTVRSRSAALDCEH